MILAPLRGVTIRCFREVFAEQICEAGFTEAITPFLSANPGFDPLKDRELRRAPEQIKVTPQFIGKDPASLRACLLRIKEAGYDTADLNCGCPYPMVRNKGRGMLALMPMLNSYPLRFLTVHARNARQMYGGECDWESFKKVAAVAKMPIVANGDLPLQHSEPSVAMCAKTSESETLHRGTTTQNVMIGRAFIRQLGMRDDIGELLSRYIDASSAELCGPSPILGRIKELVAYWKELPRWKRLWPVIKIARTLDELRLAY